MFDLIVVGGGAAGFFAAIQLKEQAPQSKVLIIEKSNKVLAKVRISGGGRCNFTHACFDPRELVEFYPRGNKELIGPFNQFGPGDIMAWFDDKGVPCNIEEDGRIFPASNSSETIINTFLNACSQHNIEIRTQTSFKDFKLVETGFSVSTSGQELLTKKLLLAPGSAPALWKWSANKGLKVVNPLPSLFTFNIKSKVLNGLMGLSVPDVEVNIKGTKFSSTGPLLITHWGLSGPAILKLSSWAARELAGFNYQYTLQLNLSGLDRRDVEELILDKKRNSGNQKVLKHQLMPFPKRLWASLMEHAGIDDRNYADLTKTNMENMTMVLSNLELTVNGKTTFKEEFVTCGGIDCSEVNFKSMESKKFPGLYFAGEFINIDALTGGFNFQAAWTESYIAAKHIATSI